MNKRIFLLISIIVLSTATIFGMPGNNITTASVSGEDSTNIIADAPDLDMIFVLEASPNGVWVNANGQDIYNESWNPRNSFSPNLRVRAIQGTFNQITCIKVSVIVGDLYRNGQLNSTYSDYYNAGSGAVDEASVGDKFKVKQFKYNKGILKINTVKNYFYGNVNNKDKDSLYFTLKYDGDSEAPAGRYKSNVTLQYEIV